MARIEVTAANFPGSALKGSGTDTLVLVGGGTFDFAYVTVSGFSEISVESGSSYASVRISGDQLVGVASLSSASSMAALYLTGTDIDLRGKTITNFSYMLVTDDNASVTVDNLSLALKLRATSAQGETISLDGAVTTTISRSDLHTLGYDKIVEGSNIWTNAAPTLTGLNGSFYVREGGSVHLDPEGNAFIWDDDGPISSLEIAVTGTGKSFVLSDFKIGLNFEIRNNSFDQFLFYKGGLIGQIDNNNYPGDSRANIVFNSAATTDIINEFIQTLSYAPGNFIYYNNVVVTVTARDKGQRKADAVLYVTAETNWTPTQPTLKGTTVRENVAANTVVGTLSATDANGDAVHYQLTDDEGGRFKIEGNKLVVSGSVPLDFEKASNHRVTVIANDGEKNGLPATFTISVTDVLDKLYGTKGADKLTGAVGKDVLIGGLGNDTLTGGREKDIFVFNTKLSKYNVDKITDFLPKSDKVHLENAIFKTLGKPGPLKSEMFYRGAKAHDQDDRVIYDKKTGALSYDYDGTGHGKAVHFATLTNKPDLKYTDLIVI